MSDLPPHLRIEQLMVYPVKSLGGIAVYQWPLTAEGLLYDRNWMLVLPNGRFVTQRQLPQMALVHTAIDGDHLWLSAEGKGEFRLPLRNGRGEARRDDADVFTATVWRDQCEVIEAAAEASAWLTSVLRPPHPLRLVALAPGQQRPQSQPERFGAHTHTRFADAAPLLVANRCSLDALNTELQQRGMDAVEMRRFRPNIVVSGVPAFAEHELSQCRRDDGLLLQLRDRCERCTIITVDQERGVAAADMEPYRTLATLNAQPDNPRAAVFGVNATAELPAGSGDSVLLAVGDRLLL